MFEIQTPKNYYREENTYFFNLRSDHLTALKNAYIIKDLYEIWSGAKGKENAG